MTWQDRRNSDGSMSCEVGPQAFVKIQHGWHLVARGRLLVARGYRSLFINILLQSTRPSQALQFSLQSPLRFVFSSYILESHLL